MWGSGSPSARISGLTGTIPRTRPLPRRGCHRQYFGVPVPCGQNPRTRGPAPTPLDRIGRPIVYVNLVGGQDELVFDGGSLVFDRGGACILRARSFAEELAVFDFEFESMPARPSKTSVRIDLTPDRTVPPFRLPRCPSARRGGRGACGARARNEGLSLQERIFNGGHRAIGRHRLLACRRGRRRGHGIRTCGRRYHALAVYVVRNPVRRRGSRLEPRHAVHGASHSRCVRSVSPHARRCVPGNGTRPH